MTQPGEGDRPRIVPERGSVEGELDADLMRSLAAGQLKSLEILYDRYRTMAYALALRITSEPGLAEDVVQDAFLGAWRNANRYAEAKGSVRNWLLAIVHHRAIDLLRRRRADTTLVADDELPPPVLTLPDIWPEVLGRLHAGDVRAAMRRVPGVQRQALELAYFEGLTQREIADRTAAPLGTVKSRIRLGLLALRRELGGQDQPGLGGAGLEVESSGADSPEAHNPGVERPDARSTSAGRNASASPADRRRPREA